MEIFVQLMIIYVTVYANKKSKNVDKMVWQSTILYALYAKHADRVQSRSSS
jgi:hypothetical protein